MKHDCSGEFYLWNDNGVWRFDTDDGLTGPRIYFCPFCGEKLEDEKASGL